MTLPIFLFELSDLHRLVDLSTLVLNSRLLIENVDVNDVVLVELLGPPLRNSILHFLFEHVLVWTLG